MSSLSSNEGNGFSTQDREAIDRLVNMDVDSFLSNYTGLESTRLNPGTTPANGIEADSDDSFEEMDYLEQLKNPQPAPIPVVQKQKLVENKPVIQGLTRTRSLRQRQANQLKPYTFDKQQYNAMLRRADYTELMQRESQSQHHRRITVEDRYVQEDGEDSDDEEYEEPSLDPEELPTQSLENLTIEPKRRRSSAERVKTPAKHSRSTQSEGKMTPPPADLWTTIPRAPTVYTLKKSKMRSAQEKGKGRAKYQVTKSQEPTPFTSKVSPHVEDVLRDVFDQLYSDDDAKSQSSLDSVLVRADKERIENDRREEESLEAEEQVHYNGRRRRAKRIHSLESESEDDTPLSGNNAENPSIFDFPTDPEPSLSNITDGPHVFDILPSRVEKSKGPPCRRKADDEFVVPDGSEYDRPPRKKKRTTTRGVLPYNFNANQPSNNPPVVIEEMTCDSPPHGDSSPSSTHSPLISPVKESTSSYRSLPEHQSSSRPRQRMMGEFIQRSSNSRSSTAPTQHRRSAAQNSRTARKSHSRSTNSSSRNQQASASTSRTSITPRKSKHNSRRADPNGKLYIVPGPDWTSFRRPHLTNGWAPTGEHRTRSSDQARTAHEWATEIQQLGHELPRQRPIHYHQHRIPDNHCSFPNLTSPTLLQDSGPTDPFARLLHQNPSLFTDHGMPSFEEETHLRGTCYIMLGYLKQLLSPEDAAPSIGAFETSIQLFGRKVVLMQDVDQTIQSIRALFREVFKRIGSFFEKHSTTIPAAEKELEIAKLMPFFRFVSERLINWALRLGGGQQQPNLALLNNQCKLLYTRVWAIAGMAIHRDHYRKTPPLLDKGETISHSCKALIILFIYALDWMARFGMSEDREDCKERLLWLLFWIGPECAQLLRRDDGGLTAKEPVVAEAWICILHSYAPNEGQCWQEVIQLLEQQTEQAGWTASQKKQMMFHWLLVLNGLRHVDSSGIYTRPLAGIASVDGLCGHELARELITATAL